MSNCNVSNERKNNIDKGGCTMNKMDKEYQGLEVEVIVFACEDLIRTSVEEGGAGNFDGYEPGWW